MEQTDPTLVSEYRAHWPLVGAAKLSTKRGTLEQLVLKPKRLLISAFFGLFSLTTATTFAADTPDPITVTIPGNLQESLGCPGNWQPECPNTQLRLIETANVWKGSFDMVTGDYEYKVALNQTWDENYGANAERNGGNIALFLDANSPVNFYYDHQTNWVTDNHNSRIAIAAGSFQEFLGCSGNWQPDCLNGWLQDIEGDGVYSFTTTAIPAGDYQAKVTIDESWAENYGQGGVRDGANIEFSVPADGEEMFFKFESASNKLTIKAGGEPNGNLAIQRAQWLSSDTLAWDSPLAEGDQVVLHSSPTAELALSPEGVIGGTDYVLEQLTSPAMGLRAELKAKFPHLASYNAVSTIGIDEATKRELLKTQLAVSIIDAEGNLKDASGIQHHGVLDDLFVFDGELGPKVESGSTSVAVWAPTAQNVEVLLFDASTELEPSQIAAMTEDAQSGVWSAEVGDWNRKFYRFRVTVFTNVTNQIEVNDTTDPYSLSLSTNSRMSQFVNLDDRDLKPGGWDHFRKPRLRAPEDISIYELHVRDFSIADKSVPTQHRGTYGAFSQYWSRGMRHLRSLSRAGLTHIHLLPAFDIATVNEEKSERLQIEQDLSLLAPDSQEQQEAVTVIQNQDGFNWGYDPLHYTVPEGSYSTNADGATRIREFRQMVKALNRIGLRVVMDVVYNHTSSFGQFDNSVLDKIVPGYYHRYNADGGVEMSSCCANTASENRMMEKLMIDSLLVWAKAYKVDGFRFDLMGHHSKQNMLNVQSALSGLTRRKDGVDGRGIYVYGEGWNFGEVANDARFEQATQLNMAGTGIGSFDDRGRDAIRGGNPFGGYQDQGFGNGLFTNPNGVGDDSENTLLTLADRTRSSLAAGLKDYEFETSSGEIMRAEQIDYSGLPTGYTDDPQEQIAYIAAHDNETLFDGINLKAPQSASVMDRARMQNFSSSIVLLGQGVPFIHAGQDFLRSKSMDRDSFNSGDWFNAIDFTFRENGWGKGLPVAEKNRDAWPIMAPLLANVDLKPSPWLSFKTSLFFKDWLRIRYSSPLYRLRNKTDVQRSVTFLNTGPTQIPGVIVMRLSDPERPHLREQIVIFNGSNQEIEFSRDELGVKRYRLHPAQRRSLDRVTAKSVFRDGVFTVPAMSTAVFIAR